MKSALFLLFILSSFATPVWAAAEFLDGVYATVNDEMISNGDVQNYEKLLKKRAMVEELLFTDEATMDRALKERDFLLQKLVAEKILDSEAKKLGINIPDDRINKDVQSKGGDAHLTSLLVKEGYTLKDYKNFLRKSLARKEVVNYYVSSKIKISDDDILDFYTTITKGKESGQGFEFNLSHVLFPYTNDRERQLAADRAQEALKALQQGQTFTALHSKFNPKEKDDAFGVFKSGEMLPAIEAAVSNLRAGDTSQVVETPLGFHIFKLNSKKIVNNSEFEKRKQQIFRILFDKSYKEQLDYWISQRRKSAVVKVIGETK